MTLPVPTRRLAAVALALSVALLVADVLLPGELEVVAGFGVGPTLALLNGTLLLAMIVDARLAPDPSRLGLTRALPEVLALGAPGSVRWTLRNPARYRITVDLADELVPSLHPGSRGARLHVGPRRHAEATTTIRPARRGRFPVEAVAVRVGGPLGLGARQRSLTVPGMLRVFPPFHSRDEAELRIDKARILEVGLRSAKGRGGGTEFDQLREYTIDDEFKRIDWPATARLGKPIVRTYRAERNQTVVMLLDNGRVMAARVADVPRVEWAMDAVMMLTYVATRLGDRAGLLAFDRTVRAVVPPAHTRDQLGRVTEAMYELEPELHESDYRGAFVQTLARFRRRTLLVVFTDLVEQAVGESLLPALPLLTRNHLVIVAAVTDPEVAAWASSVPEDPAAAFRKAAAVTALRDRRHTAARLRGLGVTVVDAPPGALAAELADAYLHVKATGRL